MRVSKVCHSKQMTKLLQTPYKQNNNILAHFMILCCHIFESLEETMIYLTTHFMTYSIVLSRISRDLYFTYIQLKLIGVSEKNSTAAFI